MEARLRVFELQKLSTIEKILVAIITALVVVIFVRRIGGTPRNDATRNIQPKSVDLGITYRGFINRYNALTKWYELPEFALTKLYLKEKNDVETFFYDLGGTVVLFGDKDKTTGLLTSVTVGCEPEKGYSEKGVVSRAGVAYIFVIRVLSPELTEEQSKEVMTVLASNLKNYSVLKGNIRYRSHIYNGMLLLSAEGKDFR